MDDSTIVKWHVFVITGRASRYVGRVFASTKARAQGIANQRFGYKGSTLEVRWAR